MSKQFEVNVTLKNTGEVKTYETDALILALNAGDKVSGAALYDGVTALDLAFMVSILEEKIQEIYKDSPEVKMAVQMIKEYDKKESEEK